MTDLRRLAELNREGPEDPGRRDVLKYLIVLGSLAAGATTTGLLVREILRDTEYHVIDVETRPNVSRQYLVIEDNPNFFELDEIRAREGDTYISLGKRLGVHKSDGTTDLDRALTRINRGPPKANMLCTIAIDAVRPGQPLYEIVQEAYAASQQ